MTHPSKSEREYLQNPYESPRNSSAICKVVGKMRFIDGVIVMFFLLPLLLAPFCWHEIKLRLPPTSSPWEIVIEFLVLEVLLAIVTWSIGMALVVSSRPSGPFLKIATAVLGIIAFLAAYFLLDFFLFL
ncbi:MAG: hypothetical protein KDA87_11585 [Planctomycetales bacterium]|nr:hypothetical protein [Planctomycetales bacterium]